LLSLNIPPHFMVKKLILPSLVDEEDQIEEDSPDQQADDDDI